MHEFNPLENAILKEMEWARAAHRDRAAILLLNGRIGSLLGQYAAAIEVSRDIMKRSGVADGCRECASLTPGGCCFQGVEEWYDRFLLLSNLLIGVGLPDVREVDGCCFFLGNNGCKLKARHAFCVNFLCPGLRDRIGPGLFKELIEASGIELRAGWELENALRSCPSLRNTPPSLQG